jgi:hypothetical protein
VTKGPVTEFSGTLSNFTGTPGDKVKLQLLDKDGDPLNPVLEGTVTPTALNGVWTWKWTPVNKDDTTNLPEVLKDGNYTLKATIVTSAGVAFTHVGAMSEKNLVIDTTGPQGDKGLSIVSMSVDSGVGSFNPLDDSRKDFKTNDNTPVFTGTLTTDLPTGEQIAVQLLKDGVVVESGFATVSGTGWTWAPKAPLADATYKLNARVVDAAGNPASEVVNGVTRPIAPASKDVVIDTKGPTDGTDPNSGLKISGISISSDTAANGINNDFVTSDGGNKDKSTQVNEDDKLTFTGTLSSAFDKNGGKVLVQIVDMDGKIKSSAYVEPTGSNWTYEHIGELAEGQYVAKTILLDHVGNMISAKDQSFLIDITSAKYNNIGQSTDVAANIEKMEFGVPIDPENFLQQYGTYKYGNIVGDYFGGNLNLGIQNGTTFLKGSFKMTFWDQAGNQTDVVNDKDWTFNNSSLASLTATSAGAVLPKDLNGGQIIGSVGKFDVSGNFDMASLYDGIDAIADQGAANHIALSNASNATLTLSMGDVLALGVTNSFSIASVTGGAQHKNQIQMRIDGQADDKLNLDGLVNGLNLPWVKSTTAFPLDNGPERYDVYTNASLSVALFVDTDITVNVL